MTAAAVDTLRSALESHGCRPRRNGRGWAALCPCHERDGAGHAPSLAFDRGTSQGVVLHCHAGCEAESVLRALGLGWTDLDDKPRPPHARVPDATYVYENEEHRPLFRVLRFGFGSAKSFRQERFEAGQWVTGPGCMTGVRRVLYRLPAVLAAIERGDLVYCVEGERDADAINGLDGSGFVATSPPGGAQTPWRAEYSETLRGARLLIIADKDAPGRRHARAVARALRDVAESVEIRQPPGEHKDAQELLAAGGALSDLEPVTDEAPPEPAPEPGTTRTLLEPCDLAGILDPNAGQVDYLIDGLIPKGELTVIAAAWKTAKSLILYALALDAITGRRIWGVLRTPEPLRVTILQFEMPHREDLRRLRRLALGSDTDPRNVHLAALEHRLALHSRPGLMLANAADAQTLRALVERDRSHLVIVDSATAAFRGEDLNDNPTVTRCLMTAFQPLTTQGISVILCHHERKRTSGGKDDPKSAILGAQAFAACAGRIYGLERLAASTSNPGFKLRLHLLGAWAPSDDHDLILSVEDTPNGHGTTVRLLDESAQIKDGGLTTVQQAALNIKNRVSRRGRISRKDALIGAQGDLGISESSAKRGLAFALVKSWVLYAPANDRKHAEQDLLPGPGETHEIL